MEEEEEEEVAEQGGHCSGGGLVTLMVDAPWSMTTLWLETSPPLAATEGLRDWLLPAPFIPARVTC